MSNIHIIRANGTEEDHTASGPQLLLREVAVLIGAACLDGFNLRNGKRVWVNDNGLAMGLPVNPKATALYHSICRPGTTQPIVGDVAIVAEPTQPEE